MSVLMMEGGERCQFNNGRWRGVSVLMIEGGMSVLMIEGRMSVLMIEGGRGC